MKVMILSERALRRLPASCDASDVSCMTGDDSAAGAAADTAKRRRTESEHSLFEDHYWPDLPYLMLFYIFKHFCIYLHTFNILDEFLYL